MPRSLWLSLLLLPGLVNAGPLAEAARRRDTGQALTLLQQGADVNDRDEDGSSALQWAVHHDEAVLIEALLKGKADARAVNDYGASAMSEAAVVGNTSVIGKLLKAGADPDSPNARGQTALMLLARTGNVAAARRLLRAGANVNAVEGVKGQTALMWAAAQRQPQMVRELLAHGADANAISKVLQNHRQVSGEPRAQTRSYGGFTPLLFASRQGCLACVQALVEKGADVELADPEGITPLLIAIDNFNFDVADWLLSNGANPNLWDLWGRSPLYLAVDLNTVPRGGRADMASLDRTTSLQLIERLLAAGANPDLQLKLFPPYRAQGPDRGGDTILTIGATPLFRAAKAADVPAMKLLLARGAKTGIAQIAGIDPLMAAAGLGSSTIDTRGSLKTAQQVAEAVQLLIAAGADLGTRDRQGRSALHGAASWGFNDAVRELAAGGAMLDARDTQGFTALDYALGKGTRAGRGQSPQSFPETAELLRELGATATPAAPVPAQAANQR